MYRDKRGKFRQQVYGDRLMERIKPVIIGYFVLCGVLLNAYLVGYAGCELIKYRKQNGLRFFEGYTVIQKGKEYSWHRINRGGLVADVPVSPEPSQPVQKTVSADVPVEERIRQAFGQDGDVAVAVARAESSLEPDRVGDKHLTFEKDGATMGMSCGLFQIRVLPGRPTCEELLDIDFNIQYARELYEKSGWYPWSVFKSGRYLSFL